MEKTWRPTAAGILNIISGALSAFGVIGLIIVLVTLGNYPLLWQFMPPGQFPFLLGIVQTLLIIFAVLGIVETVVPIVGGVYALQRRKWGWALAGSITAILGSFVLGILATTFVALAKEEFVQNGPQALSE
jgi:hypothetical protein